MKNIKFAIMQKYKVIICIIDINESKLNFANKEKVNVYYLLYDIQTLYDNFGWG